MKPLTITQGVTSCYLLIFTISCYDFKSVFNLSAISKQSLYFKIIIILIQVMNDFNRLTVISVEYYCKVNPVWFQMFNNRKYSLQI